VYRLVGGSRRGAQRCPARSLWCWAPPSCAGGCWPDFLGGGGGGTLSPSSSPSSSPSKIPPTLPRPQPRAPPKPLARLPSPLSASPRLSRDRSQGSSSGSGGPAPTSGPRRVPPAAHLRAMCSLQGVVPQSCVPRPLLAESTTGSIPDAVRRITLLCALCVASLGRGAGPGGHRCVLGPIAGGPEQRRDGAYAPGGAGEFAMHAQAHSVSFGECFVF